MLAALLAGFVASLPGLAFAGGEHHQGDDWVEWTQESSLPSEAGKKYYLSKDVELNDTWDVPAGEDGVTLDLNGKEVSLAEEKTGDLVQIADGRKLTIDNCMSTGAFAGKISVKTGGTLQVQGKVKADEVSLSKGEGKDCVITVSGKLEEGAEINVTKLGQDNKATTGVITSGYKDSNSEGGPSKYFKSKDPAYMVGWDKDNKEAELVKYLAFDANGEGATGTMDPIALGETALDLPKCAYSRDGFVFVDWNTKKDGSGTSYTDEQKDISFAETTTLYAQWGHKVSFNKNADDATGTMKDAIARVGKELKLPKNAYTRDGYDFLGWTLNKDGSGDVIPDEGSHTFDADTTLYAKWKYIPKQYKVTFSKKYKQAEGTMDKQSFIEGEEFTLNANKFILDGYTFTEWNTKQDGSGTSYANKAKVTFTSNVVLYAQWKKKAVKTYTISFNPNGGTGTMDNQTATQGKDLTLSSNTFTREGYTFSEWNTEADGSGTSYADGATTKFSADTTLYAQWELSPDMAIVTFDKNAEDATGSMEPQLAKKGESLTLEANAFVRQGYTFNGWNTKADGSGTKVPDKANVKLNSNVTLYAQWTKNGSQTGGVQVAYDIQSGAPQVSSSNLRTIAETMFSEAEKSQGAKLTLTASPRTLDGLADAEKKVLTEFIGKYKLTSGVVFDMSLSKQVGEGSATAVTSTPQKVSLTVQVPSNLQSTSATNRRTFYLLRVHDGQVSALAGSTATGLTAQTDAFSTYAIAYRDGTTTSGGGSSTSGYGTRTSSSSTSSSGTKRQATAKTGDSSVSTIAIAAIAAVGVGVLVLGVMNKRKHRS